MFNHFGFLYHVSKFIKKKTETIGGRLSLNLGLFTKMQLLVPWKTGSRKMETQFQSRLVEKKLERIVRKLWHWATFKNLHVKKVENDDKLGIFALIGFHKKISKKFYDFFFRLHVFIFNFYHRSPIFSDPRNGRVEMRNPSRNLHHQEFVLRSSSEFLFDFIIFSVQRIGLFFNRQHIVSLQLSLHSYEFFTFFYRFFFVAIFFA